MTRFDINDGNAQLESDNLERHSPYYKDFRAEHPFIKKALQAVRHADAPSLYGVHVYVLIDEDGQRDGVYFDAEPLTDSIAWDARGRAATIQRALERVGFITEPKTDGRFRRDESNRAIGAVGHEVIGKRVPSDFEVRGEHTTDA